jgi:hypothetical protein
MITGPRPGATSCRRTSTRQLGPRGPGGPRLRRAARRLPARRRAPGRARLFRLRVPVPRPALPDVLQTGQAPGVTPCGGCAGDFQAGVSLTWAKSCWLESQGPQAFAHETRAERASSACNHAFGDGWAMLRAEILPCPDNWVRSRAEPFDESSVVSRSVIGTLGQSSGNRNWCYDNRADVRPEFTFILHLPFPLPLNIAKSICIGCQL